MPAPVRRKRLLVAQACEVPYGSMEPKAEGRYCGSCDRVVADLTKLTRREAIALFEARGGDLCGYLAHDSRGEPLHTPEPAPALLALAVASLIAACDPAPSAAPSATAPLVLGDGSVEDAASAPDAPGAPGLMMPIDPSAPARLEPAPAADQSEVACSSASGGEASASDEPSSVQRITPTAADRARERRKRAARLPPPHTQFAGMMMLSE